MDKKGFHPLRSNDNPDLLAAFISAPTVKELQSVSGIGPKNKEIFHKNGIFTTHQLMSKFLSFSEEETDCVELCDKFYFWMKMIGINSHRGAIVRALGEKLTITIPGIYDSKMFDEDKEKDNKIEIKSVPSETESESEAETVSSETVPTYTSEIVLVPSERKFKKKKSRTGIVVILLLFFCCLFILMGMVLLLAHIAVT